MRFSTMFRSAAFALALVGAAASAQTVTLQGAWVRASVPGQKTTGAFMKITSQEDLRLVGASTPAAAMAELHEMKMDGDVMRMRAVEGGLELPAGKPVALTPGGYHLMLMDLKAPLPVGSTVSLTLICRDAKGVTTRYRFELPVSAVAPEMSGAAGAHSAMAMEEKH
ncbi:MAG: Copper metallochaperone PCu(A)C, inserts Cu(I) into cytochrome oxidase subunit II [Burkholderiaceae bacterium]|jgi:copper(I)-binding protein|nr:MAG: Copper metallochaperone PCu(A)C, inserts Cu(I) into cytochrome oxidase subunit II [Burkholderiaceae bacterium]